MTDESPSQPDHSGSRWEPIDVAPEPFPSPAELPAERVRHAPLRKARVALAAGALALIGLAGAGGVVIGHAMSGDGAGDGAGDGDGSSVVDRDGVRDDFPGTPPDGDGDGPPGALPGTGTGSDT